MLCLERPRRDQVLPSLAPRELLDGPGCDSGRVEQSVCALQAFFEACGLRRLVVMPLTWESCHLLHTAFAWLGAGAPEGGELKLQGVWFAYPSRPSSWVLKGVDLHVEPGKKVSCGGL